MDSETTLLVHANRQFIYELLARAYAGEPDADFIGVLRQEHTRAELALVGHELTDSIVAAYDDALAAVGSCGLDELRADYTAIFIGPGTLKADPWESVHLSDTRALFQQELLPIREAYRAAGFLPARYPHVQDDFIGLELDFLAKLAGAAKQAWEAGDAAAAEERLAQSRAFLDEHLLRWVDSLATAIERGYGDGFYARFTRLAALAARRDLDVIA